MNYYALLLIHQKFSISKAGKMLKSHWALTVYWTPNSAGTNEHALFHTQGNAVRHLSKFLHLDKSSGYLFPNLYWLPQKRSEEKKRLW